MNDEFAKIFDINTYQVLITKVYDYDKRIYYFHIETKIDKEQIKIKIEFDTEEEIKEEYDTYTITEAMIFRNWAQNISKEKDKLKILKFLGFFS